MKRRYHVQFPTIAYMVLMAMVIVAAVNTQRNLLFWVFGVMVSGLAISGVLSGAGLLGLRIRRLDPQHGAVGEPLTVRYEVLNRRWWLPIFNVQVEELPPGRARLRGLGKRLRARRLAAIDEHHSEPWPRFMSAVRTWIMHISPRERTHADAVFWPTMRGRVQFDRLRLSTTFPFGIVKKSITLTQPQHTLIFPLLYQLQPHVLSAVAPYGPMGSRMSGRAGSGGDYYGVREYRSGDSARMIAWKHSARLDRLVTIERSLPSPPRLRVMLNLSRPTADLRTAEETLEAKAELEERAISLAASIIHAADLGGYEIGLTVLGLDVPQIPIRRSRWHLSKMLSALAAIETAAPRRPVSASDLPFAERAGAIVIHPDRVSPELGRGDALHLTATQLDTLTTGVLGWDPTRIKRIIEGGEARERSGGAAARGAAA